MIRLEVAVSAPLISTLSYSFEPGNEEDTGEPCKYTGRRVLVPLGRRKVTGYVIGCLPQEDVKYTIKEIFQFLDESPLFHENSVSFFKWIADYYHYPLGEVIATALPAGLNRTTKKIISLKPGETGATFEEVFKTAEVPGWYSELVNKKRLSFSRSRAILKDTTHTKLINQLKKRGLISVQNELSESLTKEKLEICYEANRFVKAQKIPCEITRESIKDFWINAEEIYGEEFGYAEAKTLFYFFLRAKEDERTVPRKELLKAYKNAEVSLKNLVKRDILKKISRRVYRNPFGDLPEEFLRPETLSDEQSVALSEITAAIEKRLFAPFLLFGVTGGGKTEVYLRAAEKCIEKGRDVLVLVPEIALATQLESHFVSRFPGKVALLHSGLSNGEKFDQWTLAAQGKAKIVIGARSGVFAPLEHVGLIIVDEEHDSGFKQDDGLRYNGRDLAVLRARKQGCTVVLGSATPSVTSYHNAVTGKYRLLTIINRIGEGSLPEVEVIDLNKKNKGKEKSLFHHKFTEQLRKNLVNQEQSLVLLNRRGFSASYLCSDCGTPVMCRDCNVTLTYHKHRSELKCHYCGYHTNSNLICENCNSDNLIPFGVGTERVEEALKEKFPDAVIYRLDSDTAADRKKFISVLKKMREGEIDILIGTQMIAKGHHFPNVTFVGVVWADGGLNMPDFRAAEKTYQLLSQVTGRAGRGKKKGRVIVQSMRPSHYAVEFARRHRYDLFFEKEIGIRKRPAFPPFVRLIQIKIVGEYEHDVRQSALNIAALCRGYQKENNSLVEIMGPASAPLEKINRNYRWQILLKSDEIDVLHTLARFIQENKAGKTAGKTKVTLDVDPENMM